jgi:hypothetical protein
MRIGQWLNFKSIDEFGSLDHPFDDACFNDTTSTSNTSRSDLLGSPAILQRRNSTLALT